MVKQSPKARVSTIETAGTEREISRHSGTTAGLSTKCVAALEQNERNTSSLELACRGEPRETSTDNHNIG
jgi:hypothetical protein